LHTATYFRLSFFNISQHRLKFPVELKKNKITILMNTGLFMYIWQRNTTRIIILCKLRVCLQYLKKLGWNCDCDVLKIILCQKYTEIDVVTLDPCSNHQSYRQVFISLNTNVLHIHLALMLKTVQLLIMKH
jgi:hypothetical protein